MSETRSLGIEYHIELGNIRRDTNLEKRLGLLISQNDSGNVNLRQLMKAAEKLKYEVIENDADSWDSDFSNILLKEALSDIELLHDSSAGVSLDGYRDCLLGKKESDFIRKVEDKVYKIRYLPYAKLRGDSKLVEIVELLGNENPYRH